jgi:DNA-binding SARP family transcriptional activator/tetratricopeptide (TPR) repeat protein
MPAMPETEATPPARLRLFGPLTLDREGHAVPIPSRRSRALLGYLALQPDRRETRSRLAGLLWADRAEAQARASLRQCLLELRNQIGQAQIDASREWVALAPHGFRTDVGDLDAAIAQQDFETILELESAAGAKVLLDEPAVSDLHQDWLDRTREASERRLADGMHNLLAATADVDPQLCRRLAEALIVRQPLDEPAVAAAMRADVVLGAGAAAILRYNALRGALNRDLGVNPGEEVCQALKSAMTSQGALPHSDHGRPSPVVSPLVSPPLLIVSAFSVDDDFDLAESMREEIIAGLSRFRDLALVSDNRFENDIMADAWVRRDDAYLLAGAFRSLGPDKRLNVQLVRLSDRRLIWSGKARIGAEPSARSVDDIVTHVVGAAYPSIHEDLEPRLPAGSPGTYARYLRARRASLKAKTFEDAKGAADALEALIADDPSFSFAYLPLARLYNTDFIFTRAGSSDRSTRDRAFELAKSALALDRGHVHAYTVMGWCQLWRGNWDAAQWHFDQAVELNPFHADRLMEVGYGHIFLGDLVRARAYLERCLVLNPTPKDGFFLDLGLLEFLEGRFDLAANHFDRVADQTVFFDDIYAGVNAVAASIRSQRPKIALNRIMAIWPADVPADPESLAAWFSGIHPFKSQPLARKLNDGFRQMVASALD